MYDNIKNRNKFICGVKLFFEYAEGKEEEIVKGSYLHNYAEGCKKQTVGDVNLFAYFNWRILEINCLWCEAIYVVVHKKIVKTLSEMSS